LILPGEARAVLEVGCGSGLLAALALSLLHPDAKFHALDLSPEMVNIASKRLSHFGDRVSLTTGNSEKLEFADNTFDRYWANYVLHLTPSPETMLKEAYRVVKPGGFAAFAVWGRKENSPQVRSPGAAFPLIGDNISGLDTLPCLWL
jgi:ubiquinone/menaquinone biosynthesis C-methylase UbiE